jgi:hypothetical protein
MGDISRGFIGQGQLDLLVRVSMHCTGLVRASTHPTEISQIA